MAPVKVLVCPLDWGIGHATRCVPVIRLFLETGAEVVVAADGRPLEFLRTEFPGCRFLRFPGARIRYHHKTSLTLQVLFQLPGFLAGIWREHRFLEKIVQAEKPDVVVSDNRYGLWNGPACSIFITHQLQVRVPGGSGILSLLFRKVVYSFIRHYRECWIPDFELHGGLAGDLSHPGVLPPNAFYIGTLSRFSGKKELYEPAATPEYDVMAILSGPEPQRTVFEGILIRELQKTLLRGVIVRGRTEVYEERDLAANIRVCSHLGTEKMKQVMMQSRMIICRSGYSSLMDLVTLVKRAILVPTPGQTEQEYLARILMDKKIYFSMPQKRFDLIYALEMSVNYPGMVLQNDYRELKNRIEAVLGSVSRGSEE